MSTSNFIPKELYQTWRHSYEDDEAGIEVYRPDGYDFPPARGRNGFSFEPEGTFAELPIGRDDRIVSQSGRWQADATTDASTTNRERIHLTRAHEMAPSETIEIVEVSGDLLKIRRLGPPGMW